MPWVNNDQSQAPGEDYLTGVLGSLCNRGTGSYRERGGEAGGVVTGADGI
jgi:hypothetical protein